MLSRHFAIAIFTSAVFAAGCGGPARGVEVTGQVSSAATDAPIILDFFDVRGDQKTSVHSAETRKDGSFKEVVPLEGDELVVRAVADATGNEACSEGEQWAQLIVKVQDDQVEPLQLTLGSGPCPIAP